MEIRAFSFKPTLDKVEVYLAGELTGSAAVVNGNVLVYYMHDDAQNQRLRHFIATWAGKWLPPYATYWAMVNLGQGQVIHVVEVPA